MAEPMGSLFSSQGYVNVLTASAAELSELLVKGCIRSVDLVNLYLAQVERHNKKGACLNAMISTALREKLIRVAEKLDHERANKGIRTPLHGIPVIIKDNICTAGSLEMATTCGTVAFSNALCNRNADIVHFLLKAGMIVIGKSNLSEMAGMKGHGLTPGLSALGGQTQSAYVVGGVETGDTWLGHSTPGGSSSGSAVGVSAGFAPVAIGTETDGSIIVPSERAGIYALKATIGSLSIEGTLPYTPFSDTAGPMGKSAKDIAMMMSVLAGGKDYSKSLTYPWDGLSVGFVDPAVWKAGNAAVNPNESYNEQVSAELTEAVSKIEKAGATVTRNVALRRFSAEDNDLYNELSWHDYALGFSDFTGHFENPPVRNMKELVEFNNENLENAIPPGSGQEVLIDAVNHAHDVTVEKYKENCKVLREHNRVQGVDKALSDYGVDVIMGPPTGRIATVAAAAGYPAGNVPLGYADFNGRPFGMIIVAPANREDLIIRAMSAWEATFSTWKPPPQLVDQSVEDATANT